MKLKAKNKKKMHYCPGCTHMTIHKILGDCIDNLGIREKVIGVAPVGCAVLIYKYFNFEMLQAPHGRAPAAATGIKRNYPENLVFTYQGDGDLASIGTAEIIHSAARGENIVVIFVNNAIYGMTGGQMAPTTLNGQITTTCQEGRDVNDHGFTFDISKVIAEINGTAYVTRQSVHDRESIEETKKAMEKAFKVQQERKGFSLVEILSTCPTNWGLTPAASLKWLKRNMLLEFPLGDIKEVEEVG